MQKDISLQLLLEWHRILLKETKADIAGKIRKHQVAISGSKFMPPFPAEVYPLLREFFSRYEKNKSKLHPVELAALVHLKFVTIHPFSDGNGRISRIIMNFVLHKKDTLCWTYLMLEGTAIIMRCKGRRLRKQTAYLLYG